MNFDEQSAQMDQEAKGTKRSNFLNATTCKVPRRDLISCRDVLWFLTFSGFAINYMLRINLNLTIVAMVLPRPIPVSVAQCDTKYAILVRNRTIFQIPENNEYKDRFAWSEYQQGLLLGSYYWLHWLTQIPGGVLARRYGTKLVFGLGNFITAICGYFIPLVTHYHIYALIFLRVVQGLIAGVVWPSMHDMAGKWIPPNERSKFVSAYLGSSVGTAVTYPLCAAISTSLGWAAAFHVTSTFGVVWYFFWLFCVYDSPELHPRISDEEKKYIMDNVPKSTTTKETKIPWIPMLTSFPVWVSIIAQFGGAWGFLTVMTQAPTYFNFIHGWNVNETGLLAGAPYLARMVFSFYYAVLSDWLIRNQKMSLTNVRKLATFVAAGLQGFFTLLLGFSGCHPTLAITFMMLGTVMNGAISSSTLANFIDLSPNYASVLLGICGMIVVCSGFISPVIVGILTDNNQTLGQWQVVFIIASLNSLIGCGLYLLFGTSKEQPWNKNPTEVGGQEAQRLATTSNAKPNESGGKK